MLVNSTRGNYNRFIVVFNEKFRGFNNSSFNSTIVIGAGTKKELAGEDIRRLMAGGAEISDLEQELSAI